MAPPPCKRGTLHLLWFLIKLLQPFIGPAVILGYPLYSSVKALQEPFVQDNQRWLSYWVVYSAIHLLEVVTKRALNWIPVWPCLKIATFVWLALPPFDGASWLYHRYIRHKIVPDQEGFRELQHESQEVILRMIHPQTQQALDQYIKEHGQACFETLVKLAARGETSAKTPKSSVRVFFAQKMASTQERVQC